MKKNNKSVRLFSFVSLYLMVVLVFVSGIIIVPTSNTIAQERERLIETQEVAVVDNTKSDVEEEEEIEEEVVVEPTIVEKMVMIKSTVGGLNIREDKSTDSRIIGVMYADEIGIAKVGYIEGQGFVNEEWIPLNKGYVKAEYVDIIDDIDLSDYQLTDKGTYIRNPILSDSVIQKSYVTFDQMLELTYGTALTGIEQAVVDVEQEYGINGLFVYAVARLESGMGTSPIAQDKNNLFGMNAQDHDPYNLAYSYSSYYESVYDFADRIKRYYINKGRTSLEEINEKYSSDPEWHDKVFNIMVEAYNTIAY